MGKRVLFIFIDGLGVGAYDRTVNPCAHPELTIFNNFSDRERDVPLPFKGRCKPLDASLGAPGIPQSATGQTALLTGINAAKVLGRHLSGFPNETLRNILAEHSIFTRLTRAGLKAAFLNTYRPLFFEKGPEALLRFLSVTSIANWKAGLKFQDFDDLLGGRSVYHDFTNRELIDKGFDVPARTAEEAGKMLAGASTNFDFSLYEYFITDAVGHKQNRALAEKTLLDLDRYLHTTLTESDLNECVIMVSSDHGNIEDISIKTHTKNPVPLLIWGRQSEALFHQINAITDITDAVIDFIMK
ncbi:MAG: hypothetical protein V2J62_06870 [candidate division KSB1 bacterium]|jgi:hypothetical protein|nr:hypothetical protein [candidate division KSB1 bacterium]